MTDLSQNAQELLAILNGCGQFGKVELIGSVAELRHDQNSDIDLLLHDDSRAPWENVQLASDILECEKGCMLRDWAGSLLPEKYLISHFIPGWPIMRWVDLGCLPSYPHGAISRSELHEDRDVHLAKLLVMNAKHYLRGSSGRLRIRDLYEKALRRSSAGLRDGQLFSGVFESINFAEIDATYRKELLSVLKQVANKALESSV